MLSSVKIVQKVELTKKLPWWFFFWKCEKKKTQTFRYSPLSSWFIFFIVFHCLIKERQHMLKEIRYMSGSEMMSIILHLAVLLSGKNTFDSELF